MSEVVAAEVLRRFSKKGGRGGCKEVGSVVSEKSAKYKDRKADLQRFHTTLSRDPGVAQEKYDQIKALPPRKSGKTELLHELEATLKRDQSANKITGQ